MMRAILCIMLVVIGGRLLLPAEVAPSQADQIRAQRQWAGGDTEKSARSAAAVGIGEVDAEIEQIMLTYHVPGLSACVVCDGEVIWSNGYGWANISLGMPAADTTVFMLASISKTVTGMALLQLWENGRFLLDDDINDYLPFPIQNPHYPAKAITFRQLLTHTSSLKDNWDVMFSTYCIGDSPFALEDYAFDYFHPDGGFYDADANFASWAPGTSWAYTNHNFVLAAYLVRVIAGVPFADYCRDSIFAPLQMDETSWFIADLDTNNIAMPYHYTGGRQQALGHFSYADYPAGALFTSAVQLGHHLIAFGDFGRFLDTRVLDSSTVVAMRTIQNPSLNSTQGLIWFRQQVAGRVVWRHGGGDQGVSTIASYCSDERLGVVVLTNGESHSATGLVEALLYNTFADIDGDGIRSADDNCPETANPDQSDGDQDDVGDSCDNCWAMSNPGQDDYDSDDIGDLCDPCTDGDGDGFGDPGYVANTCPNDNCVFAYNPSQSDADGDLEGDACDGCTDSDGDGFGDPGAANYYCPEDNCPEDPNPDQSDVDADGVGDACCCMARVGDVNGEGGDEPTVGDVSTIVDALFISGPSAGIIGCIAEADVNQSGADAPDMDDITIGDISILIDYLFITGPTMALPECL